MLKGAPMTEQVSAFPPIQMHVYPDTSGEVKVSGQITPISPTGNSGETMLQLIGVATDTAQKLGRPVQATAIDATGTRSVLLVDAEGNVTDLTVQGRRRGGTTPAPDSEAPAPIVVPPLPAISAAEAALSTVPSSEPVDAQLEVPATDPGVIDRVILVGAPGKGTAAIPAELLEAPAFVPDAQGDPVVTRRSLRDTTFLVDDVRPDPAAKGIRGLLTRAGIKQQPSAVELTERADIAAVSRHYPGTRTIKVANRKGGIGKTTTVAVLADVFGRHRGGDVLAWDNNENTGTLGWRTYREEHGASVLDVLRDQDRLLSSTATRADFSAYVHHQEKGMYDVLRSDENNEGDHEIQADEVHTVHQLVERYRTLIIMDSGNTLRAANWRAAASHADQLVIPTTTSEDSAEAAKLTLQTLESRDEHSAQLAANAVVIVSQWQRDTHSDAQRIAAQFEPFVRAVRIIPFDPALKARFVQYDALKPATQRAWLAAAAAVARGL